MRFNQQELIDLAAKKGLNPDVAPSVLKQSLNYLRDNGYTVTRKGRSNYLVERKTNEPNS